MSLTPPTKNYKHNIIAPETVELNELYTFHINIKEYSKKYSFMYVYDMYIELLSNMLEKGIEVTLYPELSRIGKFHLHGVIKFTNYMVVYEFYSNLYKVRDLATFEIDTISDMDVFSTYIKKGSKYMEPYCDKYNRNYPITHKNVIQAKRKV